MGATAREEKSPARRLSGLAWASLNVASEDTVLLKAEGTGEAWVALILRFVEDDGEGDKAAEFMWFSSEREIRHKEKKRQDPHWVCLCLNSCLLRD